MGAVAPHPAALIAKQILRCPCSLDHWLPESVQETVSTGLILGHALTLPPEPGKGNVWLFMYLFLQLEVD